ncbi:hypothetical protein AAFF_G00374250 [Aldrovandia affinis]|uniref:Uncharacterized protein n=1 Tax=Aldrovandia affinis TaxID=143900 RepID=A0AAD7SFY4_9TELE|nr:hypothetical protein AAFF_G00374250 [Aldrovandia affinis]
MVRIAAFSWVSIREQSFPWFPARLCSAGSALLSGSFANSSAICPRCQPAVFPGPLLLRSSFCPFLTFHAYLCSLCLRQSRGGASLEGSTAPSAPRIYEISAPDR